MYSSSMQHSLVINAAISTKMFGRDTPESSTETEYKCNETERLVCSKNFILLSRYLIELSLQLK